MFDIGVRKLMLKCFTLLTLLFCLFFFSKDSTKSLMASTQEGRAHQSAPTVSVSPQADSPLRIIATEVMSAELQNFRLSATVQNQSNKAIRAYAISTEAVTNKGQVGSTDFLNLTQRSGIWQPTEIRTIEVKKNQTEFLVSVKLTVDFVEFSDGTSWGTDTYKSRDILAGQRAGARLERQRLRDLLKSQGRAALVNDLKTSASGAMEALAGRNKSSEWLIGFRNGVSAVRRRLERTLQSNGAVKIEIELDKPFDTSEENPR